MVSSFAGGGWLVVGGWLRQLILSQVVTAYSATRALWGRSRVAQFCCEARQAGQMLRVDRFT